MELPTDIWEMIVKNSTKTMGDYISEIDNVGYICKLIDALKWKRDCIHRTAKEQFKNGDIVKCTYNNKLYVIYNLNYGGCGFALSKLLEIVKSDTFGKWGYYEEVDSIVRIENVMWLNMVESRVEIDKTLYKYINTLNVGDVVKYIDSNHNQLPIYAYGTIKQINKSSITLMDNIRVPKKRIVII
jgi:hypothetical protein